MADFVRKGLEAAGYEVEVAATGVGALEAVTGPGEFGLVILDLGLPDLSGFEVLERVRRLHPALPVIVLTARSEVASRIKGLDLGADDYLAKPFDFGELLARIRARLRDAGQPRSAVLEVGDLSLDLRTRQVSLGGTTLDLTAREYSLLELFMRHPGQVLSREQILDGVWGYDYDVASNVVDVYVSYLRGKLGETGGRLIETVRGGGYRLRKPGTEIS